MPRCVLKLDREHDAYVMFSTVVDGIVSDILTRDEMFAHLKREGGRATPDELIEARLVRADLSGSSSHDGDYSWEEDGGVLILNGGACNQVVPRDQLYEFAVREQEAIQEKRRSS